LSFKPLMPNMMETESDQKGCCGVMRKIVYVDNWKNKKYFIWSMAFPVGLIGYFVFYVHIVQFVKDKLPNYDGTYLVTCVAITSGVGRIIFGKIADLPYVNRIFLQQISFISIGICTMLLAAAPHFTGFEFNAMIICALIMGLFDGCFITVLGPIAFDICGPAGASQAIGFLLTILSVPLTAGPPLAGALKDLLDDYTVSFILAGIPPIFGAFFMCFIHRIKTEEVQQQNSPVHLESSTSKTMIASATVTTNLSTNMEEKAQESESLLVKNGHTTEKVEE